MRSKDEILREIERINITKEWMYEIINKKDSVKKIQEGRHAIELLNSYQSGLEFSIRENGVS